MAYLVTNTSGNYVALSHGPALKPGEIRPVHGIGSHELNLQRAGSIQISREHNVDDLKDDAIYVEVINWDFSKLDVSPPTGVTIVNMELTEKGVWYLIAPSIEKLRSWKAQLRRPDDGNMTGFDYKYQDTSTAYMTCLPGEAIFADTAFPSLYIRCNDLDEQILELEYWQVET